MSESVNVANKSEPQDASSSRVSKNPVTQIETTWVAHKKGGGEWWHRMMGALLPLSLYLVFDIVNHVRLGNPRSQSELLYRNALVVLATPGTLIHFLVLLRALDIAACAVTTPSRSIIWDTLVLTGINTRQLVIGKWRVVMQHTWLDFMMLAGLHVGIVLGLGVIVFNFSGNTSVVSMESGKAAHPFLDMLVAAVLVMAFTMVNWAFTAAAGVASSLLTRPTRFGTFMAFGVRTLAIILLILVLFLPALAHLFIEGSLMMGRGLVLLVLNAVDNGTISLAMLANPLDRESATLITSAMLSLLLYGILTVLLLWVAQRIAHRQGINT